MLVLYAALIGSAGWLLDDHAARFYSGAGPRLRHRLGAVAGRGVAGAHHRDRPSRSSELRWIRRASFAWRRSPASRVRRGRRRAMPRRYSRCSRTPEERHKKGLSANAITDNLRKRLAEHPGRLHHRHSAAARCPASAPAAASPCGSRTARAAAPKCWPRRPTNWSARRARRPGLTQVFSPFAANTPQLFVDIDRVKAQKLGVPIAGITETIQTYFGSSYVNDFNLFGRTYHVTAQADLPFRKETVRSGAPAHPQRRRRHGDARQRRGVSATSPAPTASRATISIRRPSCRATRCRAPVRRPRSTP